MPMLVWLTYFSRNCCMTRRRSYKRISVFLSDNGNNREGYEMNFFCASNQIYNNNFKNIFIQFLCWRFSKAAEVNLLTFCKLQEKVQRNSSLILIDYYFIFRDGNSVQVSDNTVFLIQRLLVKDPKHRLVADEVRNILLLSNHHHLSVVFFIKLVYN